MSELFIKSSNQCSSCKNYNFLQDVSVGYLLRSHKFLWSEAEGIYKVTNTGTGSKLIYAKPTDNYTSRRHQDTERINVYYSTTVDINFDDNKFYILYFDNDNHVSRNLLGIVEVDEPYENYLWYFQYKTKAKNPFRTKRFLAKAKFVFTKGLYIHHLAFQEGLPPWDYNYKWLKCVCWVCLEKLLKKRKVLLLNSNQTVISELRTCSRCLGQGVFHQYRHYEDGICFECKGKRYEF